MIAVYSPPETYQQWIDCFQYLQKHPFDRLMLDTLAEGSYIGQPAETYLARLSDTVGAVLTSHCRRFLRQVDEVLADGEPDMAILLASRLRRSLRKCFFYRSLPFLPTDYIQTLDQGFQAQLEFFWKNFLEHLWRCARESMDASLEELDLEMKRVRIV